MLNTLVTGAGGGIGSVRPFSRGTSSSATAQPLVRAGWSTARTTERTRCGLLAAQVVVGDLTQPQDVVSAMRRGENGMFFNIERLLAVLSDSRGHRLRRSPRQRRTRRHREHGGRKMTVSQMTLTSTGSSTSTGYTGLAEQVMDWSGLPVTHVRPTVVHRQTRCSRSSTARLSTANATRWFYPSAKDGPHQ